MKKILPIYITALLAGTAFTESYANAIQEGGRANVSGLTARPAGKNIVVTMKLSLDSLTLKSNRLLAYTPIMEDNAGNRKKMKSVLVTGRNEHYNYLRYGNKNYPDAFEMRRYNGKQQTFDYTFTTKYEPWMENSNLSVAEDLCGCGTLEDQTRIPGNPVNFHPEKDLLMAFITPKVEARKVREEKGSAFLDFPVNRTEIYPDYRKNPSELQKIISTIDVVKNDSNTTITGIDIHGYASPEGSYTNNIRLAKGRSAALKDYVSKLYNFSPNIFTVHYTPEDWDGLRKFVTESNLAVKDKLLAIIDSDLKPDPKNDKIRFTYPDDYKFMLATWYPALRHSDYTVTYTVKPFSVEEAKRVLKTKPQQLSLNEMFMVAQTYQPGSKEYNGVFETAVRMFPNDETANLNAANIALNKRDLMSAEHYLQKAGNSPEAIHAQGVLALLQKKYDLAEQLLTQAKNRGVTQAEKNLQILKQLRDMQ